MKKVLFLILCSLIPSVVFAKSRIYIRVTDFKPHYYQSRDGRWHGMAVETANLLVKGAGLKPVFIKVPWERALYSLKNGEIDMMLNLSVTDMRKKYLFFIGPHLDEIISLVVRKDFRKTINSLDDFKNLSEGIGVERGNYYGRLFEEKIKKDPGFAAKIHDVTSTEQNYRKLKSARIDGFLTGKFSIAYKIKHFPFFRNFRIHPFVVNRNPVFIGVSKKTISKKIYLRLKKAFDKVKKEKRYKEILESYM